MDLHRRDNLSRPLGRLRHFVPLPAMYSHVNHMGSSRRGKVCASSDGGWVCAFWDKYLHGFCCGYLAFAGHLEVESSAFAKDCAIGNLLAGMLVSLPTAITSFLLTLPKLDSLVDYKGDVG